MATAICGQCGDVLHWRAQRGMRLADFTCACGGAYKAAMWRNGSWKLREAPGANAGRKKAPCAICSRNCFNGRLAKSQLVTLRGFTADAQGYAKAWEMSVVIEADDVICSRHCFPKGWADNRISATEFDGETRDWLLRPTGARTTTDLPF